MRTKPEIRKYVKPTSERHPPQTVPYIKHRKIITNNKSITKRLYRKATNVSIATARRTGDPSCIMGCPKLVLDYLLDLSGPPALKRKSVVTYRKVGFGCVCM